MEEENQHDPNAVNFIPCLCFVKRGVAAENPEKVTLTKEELAKVISETKRNLDEQEDEDDDMETSDNEAETSNAAGNRQNPDDEFNFDAYDDEDGAQVAAISDIATVDPDERLSDVPDSEDEDDIIKPTDNLVLVGHVDDDAASLEVYVYNEEEGSLYVHHDFLLPSFPLCIEWMHYDPETKDPGNMCAIGCMDPIITLWDLDIQDTLEPALKLGAKGSRKKNIPQMGHKNAVLDLSWNTHFPHILASGSVDQTVILWDLDEQLPHTHITAFNEKIQTIKFSPTEAQSLLAGSCDGTVKLFDCRNIDTVNTDVKVWNFNGEIERVAWDPNNVNCFFSATNKGQVDYCDVRQEGSVLWSVNAHSDEVSAIIPNTLNGMLTTTSADGSLKIWKYTASDVSLVYEEEIGIGRVQCGAICPENGFTFAVGGDNKKKQLRLIDVREFDTVKHRFQIQ